MQPETSETRIRDYVRQANQMRGECGCAMGGKFFLAAAAVALVYLVHRIQSSPSDLVKQTLLALVGVFACSLVGKFIGIGMARIRLAFLHRQLNHLQLHTRTTTHVSLHE